MHQKNNVSFLNFPNVLETKCGQLKIELLMSFSRSCVCMMIQKAEIFEL